ncbi:hypothetical protein WH321_23675, partial [Salmonella enterica subsp. enterica]
MGSCAAPSAKGDDKFITTDYLQQCLLPDPGELNKRVLIRLRVDMPADNFGVEPQYPVTFRTWAKVI